MAKTTQGGALITLPADILVLTLMSSIRQSGHLKTAVTGLVTWRQTFTGVSPDMNTHSSGPVRAGLRDTGLPESELSTCWSEESAEFSYTVPYRVPLYPTPHLQVCSTLMGAWMGFEQKRFPGKDLGDYADSQHQEKGLSWSTTPDLRGVSRTFSGGSAEARLVRTVLKQN